MTTFPERVRDRLSMILESAEQDALRSEPTPNRSAGILHRTLALVEDFRNELTAVVMEPATTEPDRHRLTSDLGFGDVVVVDGRARRVLKVSVSSWDPTWTSVLFHDSTVWTEEEICLADKARRVHGAEGTPRWESFRSDRPLRLVESHEIDTARLPFVARATGEAF